MIKGNFWENCPECQKEVLCSLFSKKTKINKGIQVFKFECQNDHVFKREYEIQKGE